MQLENLASNSSATEKITPRMQTASQLHLKYNWKILNYNLYVTEKILVATYVKLRKSQLQPTCNCKNLNCNPHVNNKRTTQNK
jgi:hypothetical protein